MLTIPILQGTIRPKRESIKVARFVEKLLADTEDVQTQLVDPGELNLPFDGNDAENKDPNFTKLTAEADGFLIVTPEYNHSFPGTLKRMLDSELKNYIHKPVAVFGVSDGHWGGVRVVEHITPVLREIGMVMTFGNTYFPDVDKLFDEDDSMKDEFRDMHTQNVTKAITELVWMAKTLKHGRENIPSEYHS